MNEPLRSLRPWVNFAGAVLVVAVLYWTQALLVPLALAILLSFLLTPIAAWLQRRIGRIGSVLVTVTVTFLVVGISIWALTKQITNLIDNIPGYRLTIQEKLEDVREASEGNAIETVQEAIDDIQTQIDESQSHEDGDAEAEEPPAIPIVEARKPSDGLWTLAGALGPVFGPLSTAALVIVLVIFLLLERDALRRRFLDLMGHGNLAVTTKAFDEAGRRVSHQLLMQTFVNAIYGVVAGIGLYLIGVPYAFLWGSLAFLLRFVPYIGPWMGAAGPILVALAALPGWGRPIGVAGLFLVLELITNLVLEVVLYAGVAGVSPFALLIALAFWTWLWGPMGLLMGTPLTICAVVLGKHVPGLAFLSALMSETSTLPPDLDLYQRLLAHDPGGAADIIELHIKNEPAESVYDALLLPALNHAEFDRLEDRLSTEDEDEVFDATTELMGDASVAARRARIVLPSDPSAVPANPLVVLAWPANGKSDTLALRMLGHLLEQVPVTLEVISEHELASEILTKVEERGCKIVCIADLPPSAPSKTRYLVKKLRAASPELKILVGRWAPPSLADDHPEVLLDAGATHVGSTLIETRDHIGQLAQLHLAGPNGD